MKSTIRIVLISALVTAAAIKAVPAIAAEPVPASELQVSLVRTADLDLNSDAGRRQLDRRLASAAREVCGVASDADIEGKNDVRKCREDTLAQAKSSRDAIFAAANPRAVIAVTAAR